MEKYVIAAVEAWADESYAAVALSEASDGTGRYIVFMRSLDGTCEPVESEEYSLSIETGATYYGGVIEWTFRDKILDLTVTDSAADTLGLPKKVRFQFSSDEHAKLAHRGLRWMLSPQPSHLPDIFRQLSED